MSSLHPGKAGGKQMRRYKVKQCRGRVEAVFSSVERIGQALYSCPLRLCFKRPL